MAYRAGRHFLQIPGPSPVPDRISRAIDAAVIDHRGPSFADLGKAVLSGMQRIFKTKSPVVIYPSSGTGAWEACLANVLAAGDQVLFYETGQFATLWKQMADRLGIETEFLAGDWRHGVDANRIARGERLRCRWALRARRAYWRSRLTLDGLPGHRAHRRHAGTGRREGRLAQRSDQGA